ncbi:MAG: hypothetical protein IH591_07210 [Bacteroidales bacterium]|nr:hypothetical protein [Bacteroidales bacterium]
MKYSLPVSLVLFSWLLIQPVHQSNLATSMGVISARSDKSTKGTDLYSEVEGASCRTKKNTILSEFDGRHKPRQWDIHQYNGEFPYSASKTGLTMDGSGGMNQHITRRGIMIDPDRPYVIELDFIIDEPDDAPVPNSFCVNINITGEERDLDSLFCWSMNLDISPAGSQPAGVMKTMGFVNGAFGEIKPSRKVEWCRMRTTYHMIIQAGRWSNHRLMRNIVSVSVYEDRELKDSFTADYSTFPYQPANALPVRIGLNTHGANWTVKNLKIYYLN